MNRKDWEAQIYASDMNVTARCVALVVGSFGNWTEDRTVWPSTKAIADMTGLSRGTAQEYINALEEYGWLKLVKIRKNNVREYELSTPQVVESPGKLAKSNRGGHTLNGKANLSNHPATYENQVVEWGPSRLSNGEVRLSNGDAQVVESPDTNLKEPKEKNLKEPKVTTNSPDGSPVVTKESKDSPFLLVSDSGGVAYAPVPWGPIDDIDTFINKKKKYLKMPESYWQQVAELARTFEGTSQARVEQAQTELRNRLIRGRETA